jgi:hypothetical protein
MCAQALELKLRVYPNPYPYPCPRNYFCTFAQAVGRFALLHLGQYVVLSLPFPFTALGADIA